MRTSAPGKSASAFSRPRRSDGGFSLLEILVVVAIIGIFVGITVLSTDLVSFERRMEQEANRLGTLIDFVVDEALLRTQDFGIYVAEDSYHFFYFNYEVDDWVPYTIRPFEPRRLEDDMLLALRIDDREVDLETESEAFRAQRQEDSNEDLDDYPEPQIVILSSGDITPFQLEFLRESDVLAPGVELNVAFNGKSEVVRSAY